MNFFVTGRPSNAEAVEQIFERILAGGHNVTFHWVKDTMEQADDNGSEAAGSLAKQAVTGIVTANVYIHLAHSAGNSTSAELGAALATAETNPEFKIYGVHDEKKTNSAAVFDYHPRIIWKDSVEEIFTELGI